MPQVFRKFFWTEHSKIKMRQYGLSKTKLLGILRSPQRKEQGIVPGTTAVMKTNRTYSKTKSLFGGQKNKWHRKAPGEIWLMYKDVTLRHGASTELSRMSSGQERKIISAWRYPGISKPGEEIPIPEDIKREIISGIID